MSKPKETGLKKAKVKVSSAASQARLADALRANLHRRKAQAKAQQQAQGTGEKAKSG